MGGEILFSQLRVNAIYLCTLVTGFERREIQRGNFERVKFSVLGGARRKQRKTITDENRIG